MTAKSFLIVGALSLASIGIASAKSYDIILSSPTLAGSTELKPGEYKLKVEGNQAVFTDTQSAKNWTAPVKVENNGAKFDHTIVETTKKGEMDNIQSIDLGGSNTKLAFGQ
jgi:hypothetical protein